MRARFLLALGPGSERIAAGCGDRLTALLPEKRGADGQRLFVSPHTCVLPLPAVDGWILGALFSKDHATPVLDIPLAEQGAVASTRGRHLIEHYAGSYVAIWRDHPQGGWRVLRDPSGTQPALLAKQTDFSLVASDLDLLWAVSERRPTVDWERLGHALRFPQIPDLRTCVSGVSEVAPGGSVALAGNGDAELVWKPWRFRAASQTKRDIADQARHLSYTIERVIAGWSADDPRFVLELSGGLDSSILAASLRAAGASWRAITVATRAADGDERRHARAVAAHCDAALTELVLGDDQAAVTAPPLRLTPQPGAVSALRGIDRLIAGEIRAQGARRLVSGTGGDNVFCALASTAPIIDAWRDAGRSQALETFAAVAGIAETHVGAVLAALLRRIAYDALWSRTWQPDDRFLSRDLRPAPGTHPWLDLPRGTPPGLRAHIASILRIHPVITAHDRFAEFDTVFPLLSQPVLEACLAIPTWQWIIGGRDRAIARLAFADSLPATILARRRKGRLESELVRAFDRERLGLRDMLADGLLARAGFLDRPRLLEMMSRPAQGGTADYARILELVDAELWARHVHDTPFG